MSDLIESLNQAINLPITEPVTEPAPAAPAAPTTPDPLAEYLTGIAPHGRRPLSRWRARF